MFSKENYFGVAQKPSEFNAVKVSTHQNVETPKEVKEEADPRHYRPMHANITVVLLDIKAELTKVTFCWFCIIYLSIVGKRPVEGIMKAAFRYIQSK